MRKSYPDTKHLPAIEQLQPRCFNYRGTIQCNLYSIPSLTAFRGWLQGVEEVWFHGENLLVSLLGDVTANAFNRLRGVVRRQKAWTA